MSARKDTRTGDRMALYPCATWLLLGLLLLEIGADAEVVHMGYQCPASVSAKVDPDIGSGEYAVEKSVITTGDCNKYN